MEQELNQEETTVEEEQEHEEHEGEAEAEAERATDRVARDIVPSPV